MFGSGLYWCLHMSTKKWVKKNHILEPMKETRSARKFVKWEFFIHCQWVPFGVCSSKKNPRKTYNCPVGFWNWQMHFLFMVFRASISRSSGIWGNPQVLHDGKPAEPHWASIVCDNSKKTASSAPIHHWHALRAQRIHRLHCRKIQEAQ